MPRLHLTRRGTYTFSRRNRTPSPGPRGNYKLSTAVTVLPPGRAAQDLQKLADVTKKRSRARKLAAVKVALTKNLKKSDSESILNKAIGSRGRSRSRTRNKVTSVKGRSRSRSRSNTRINTISVKSNRTRKSRGRARGLTKGLSCVSARSRSCTPERNQGLRVQPVQMPSAKPDGPVPLKGTGLFIFQDKENFDPQTKTKSDSRSGRKLRMWSSFRKKVKGAAAKVERNNSVERSNSVKQHGRPPMPTPRQRHTSCSSCSCSRDSGRDTSSSTCSSDRTSVTGSVFSQLSMSPPDLPSVTSRRLADRDNNNDHSLYYDSIQSRPLPPPPVPRDSILNRRPSLPNRRRTTLTSVSSSSSSSSSGSTGGLSSGYGSLPRFPRPPPPPPRLPPPRGKVTHIKTIKLDKFMTYKWVTGVAFGRKGELVIVDLCDCYVIDPEDGSLKRQIGVPKSGPRVLQEPIDVTVMTNGNVVVSDHADQGVKIFTSKGQYLRTVRCKGLSNIAGVATNEQKEILVAGTDRQCITRQDEEGKLINVIPDIPLDKKTQDKPGSALALGFTGPPDKDGYVNVSATKKLSLFEHPYSVATNPLTGDIIVGDDYRQLVTAVSTDGKVLWKFCPHGAGARAFFPSSICVDPQGYIFIADLYNEKVYMLDSSGKYLKTLLSRGDGLKGGPGAIAVDGRGILAVADEEKSIKLFQYAENGFALTKRFSVCPDVS